MLSKKQRKSSRFYNCVVRKSHGTVAQMNAITKWKVDSNRLKRERLETTRWNRSAAPDCIPSIHWKREVKTQRQNVLSFIPRSARAIVSLFKKVAA